MKKVFIKYNPYKLETELTVDGKELAQNSKLGEQILPGRRLQEWVEDLPQILVDEFNDTDFNITFHGTMMDYEDLTESVENAYKKGILTAKIDRIPAKETSDKEMLIDKIFQKIQNGPFDELKSSDIVNAFKNAKSSDFEVCVIATMSAGKSTLINAMLGTKLMPSKQEACTAIITRIKDNDSPKWYAEVFDRKGEKIESYENISYSTLSRLNANENVSEIKITGDIPFVQAKDISLVLIDTPGPNNARNEEHRAVQEQFLNSSSKTLVLYIMEGTFGSNDDYALLNNVADSMSVGGKQSKDRFIFVLNKMDDRRKEDGPIADTLKRVKDYLENYNIYDPNIFPAAALPALNIRLIESGVEIDEDSFDETETKVKKLNRSLHFEDYAPLPSSIRDGEIKKYLNEACANENIYEQALIHSGIISIEAAIRQYVNKYAKTAKIKNVTDTFIHKLDEVGCFEETKKVLAENQKYGQEIAQRIDLILKKVDDLNAAQKFSEAVDNAVTGVNEEAKRVIKNTIKKYQSHITQKIDSNRNKELLLDEVQDIIDDLKKFSERLEQNFQIELDNLIRMNLINTCNRLLEEYRQKLVELTEDINLDSSNSIKIDSLKLMNSRINEALDLHTYEKDVANGEEWVKNTDKKWYKPWTWFQEDGYYRTTYKKVRYIKADEFAQDFLQPVKDNIYKNGENAEYYALAQSKYIYAKFNEGFKQLDNILKSKLNELRDCVTNKNKIEERIQESEKKLKWLIEIKNDLDSILEI